MSIVLNALIFARERHTGQVRKGSGAEYITHPLAVSYLVASYKRSKHLDELIAAAILHDVLEDTNTTFVELAERFTPLVASLVQELTNDADQIKRIGKAAYQQKKLIGLSSYALVLKLADRLHNITDAPSNQMVADTQALMLALRANRKLSKPQLALVSDIERECAART